MNATASCRRPNSIATCSIASVEFCCIVSLRPLGSMACIWSIALTIFAPCPTILALLQSYTSFSLRLPFRFPPASTFFGRGRGRGTQNYTDQPTAGCHACVPRSEERTEGYAGMTGPAGGRWILSQPTPDAKHSHSYSGLWLPSRPGRACCFPLQGPFGSLCFGRPSSSGHAS